MKTNRDMHDHGISESTLAKVAAKAFRHGEKNPNAFRRKPLTEEQILESPMLNHPLRQFMFCAPDEGAAAVVVCRASEAPRYTSKPIFVKSNAVRTRNLGALDVHGPWASSTPVNGPTFQAPRAPYKIARHAPSAGALPQPQ